MATIDGVQSVAIDALHPYENNAKIHDESQIKKIAESIKEFGFLNPILIDKDFNIIAGHCRTMAARTLGMDKVPAIYVEGLTDAQRRAYILADNRLTELGGWDEFLVQQELAALKDEGFNIELTGFELDIDDELTALEEEENENPTDCLPDSNCYIFSVSAFGTKSEKILMLNLEQELASHILSAIESNGDKVVSKLREALNEL